MRRRYLALHRTMETYEHECCWFAGIVLSAARRSNKDCCQGKHQTANACKRIGTRRWAVVDPFRIDSTAAALLVLAFDDNGRDAIGSPMASEKNANKRTN